MDKADTSFHLSPQRRTAITIGIMVGMVLGALEATIVGTAMPTIIANLKGFNLYSWVATAYFLTSTVTVPVWGKLSDLYGRKIFYLLGISLFMFGSALAGLANSMEMLIAARAVQGLGAGALFPVALTIIGDIYTMEERPKIQGMFSAVWGVSSIIGPIIGGFITQYFSWRWVFYINLPFGFAAIAIIAANLVEPKHEKKDLSIDYAGATVLIASLTLLLFLLTHGAEAGDWLSAPVFGLLILSVLLLALFVYLERRAKEPVLPMALFENRIFTSSSLMSFLSGAAFFGAVSFIPLFVQSVKGDTATRAGAVLTPLMLSWVTCSVICSRLLLRVGFRPVVRLGGALLVIGFILVAQMNAETPYWLILLNMTFVGSGMGFSAMSLLLAVQNGVPRQQLGVATSSTIFFRAIGGTIGVAIMGAILATKFAQQETTFRQNNPTLLTPELQTLFQNPELIINPLSRAQLSLASLEPLRGALDYSLHYVFLICLIVALLAGAAALLFPRSKP